MRLFNVTRSYTQPMFNPHRFVREFKRTLSSQPNYQGNPQFLYRLRNTFSEVDCDDQVIQWLGDHKKLVKFFYENSEFQETHYLYDQFLFWMSRYAQQKTPALHQYFRDEKPLNTICAEFIQFAFANNIFLDSRRTLESFNTHNQLSDRAIKGALDLLPKKSTIRLLGFGLDEGTYEMEIAQYLYQTSKAENVELFGFDPYARKNPSVEYLSLEDVRNIAIPFDIVIARWVLHHVNLKSRWEEFISCLDRCNPDAKVLVLEHGFLQQGRLTTLDSRLYCFVTGIFDVVANIGLRPTYFTNTAPAIGKDFYIEYLTPKDLRMIQHSLSQPKQWHIDEVGPTFPNQTLCQLN